MRGPFIRIIGALLILLAVLMMIMWGLGPMANPPPTVHSTLNEPAPPPPVQK